MHELSIASNIINSLSKKFESKNVTIQEINIEVGELTCVLPSSLEFCFQSIATDLFIKNAKLNIVSIDGLGLCKYCNTETKMPALFTNCPNCNEPGLELLQGNELNIKSVEINENV